MGQAGLTGRARTAAQPVARLIARRTGRPEAHILALIGAGFLAIAVIGFLRNVEAVIAAGYAGADWYPKFIDYLHLSFTTEMAFSPTDVSAIRPWAKAHDDGRGAIREPPHDPPRQRGLHAPGCPPLRHHA